MRHAFVCLFPCSFCSIHIFFIIVVNRFRVRFLFEYLCITFVTFSNFPLYCASKVGGWLADNRPSARHPCVAAARTNPCPFPLSAPTPYTDTPRLGEPAAEREVCALYGLQFFSDFTHADGTRGSVVVTKVHHA